MGISTLALLEKYKSIDRYVVYKANLYFVKIHIQKNNLAVRTKK